VGLVYCRIQMCRVQLYVQGLNSASTCDGSDMCTIPGPVCPSREIAVATGSGVGARISHRECDTVQRTCGSPR
jgi:hypothetical protein